MLVDTMRKVTAGKDLSEYESEEAMKRIISGKEAQSVVGGFLIALKMKGETVSEITGCAKAMKEAALNVDLNCNYAIDTCGTGGDGGRTFNISTAAAIIAASGGVKVAKHGNRAISSKSGSADVLQELGININLDRDSVVKCINHTGIGFLFAPKYHSAMRNVAPVRRELGIRTIFNILGPLTNPAKVKGQVFGVYKKQLLMPVSAALSKLGCERAMVVCSDDGLDEITTTGKTYVSEVVCGNIRNYTIEPGDFNISTSSIESINGGTAKENAKIIVDIFKGKKGPERDVVILNSAAALYVGKMADSMKDGISMADELVDSGKAYRKLHEFVEFSRKFSN